MVQGRAPTLLPGGAGGVRLACPLVSGGAGVLPCRGAWGVSPHIPCSFLGAWGCPPQTLSCLPPGKRKRPATGRAFLSDDPHLRGEVTSQRECPRRRPPGDVCEPSRLPPLVRCEF